jgi:putative endopeptidase
MILMAWGGTAFCAETPPPQKAIGINPSYRNLAVKPGDDFEEYANGGWRKTAEIPADRSSSGAAFEVFQRSEQRTAELIREIAMRHPEPGTPQEMIANYYAAFMDTANIEKRGLEPLQEKLREIEKIESKGDLARVLGKRLRADVDPLNATQPWTENLFGVWVTQALSEPDRTVPYLLQGGVGMRDREYYLSDKPETAKLRAAYQTYISELLKLAGMSDPAGRGERIMALEKKMAAVHADLVASQEVHRANNPATIPDLKSKAPGLDWQAYLAAAGLDKQPMFIIWQPGAIKGLSGLIASEPLQTWKEWLAFHTINQIRRLSSAKV